jgi:hypothetical protein
MHGSVAKIREKVLALATSVSSPSLRYRLREIDERLAELLRSSTKWGGEADAVGSTMP